MENYVGENILALRTNKGLSQKQLATLARVSQGAVSSWEQGNAMPRRSNLKPVIEAFPELDYDDIFSEERGYAKRATMIGRQKHSEMPLYGTIAAGAAREMMPIDETYPVPAQVKRRHPHGFFLKVVGESMNRRLPNGSYALVDPAAEVLDGKMYAVCIKNEAATIKLVKFVPGGLELRPDSSDPSFEPLFYSTKDGLSSTVKVLGRVVWFCLPPDFEL